MDVRSRRLTVASTRARVSHGGRFSRPAKYMLYSDSSRFRSPSSAVSSRLYSAVASDTNRNCATPGFRGQVGQVGRVGQVGKSPARKRKSSYLPDSPDLPDLPDLKNRGNGCGGDVQDLRWQDAQVHDGDDRQ